eukprot:6177816-Pleurochrysis_carterae.AAC.3
MEASYTYSAENAENACKMSSYLQVPFELAMTLTNKHLSSDRRTSSLKTERRKLFAKTLRLFAANYATACLASFTPNFYARWRANSHAASAPTARARPSSSLRYSASSACKTWASSV